MNGLIAAPQAHDLAILTESGLITEETQRQLSVATTAAAAMRKSTPVTERRFSRVDMLLSVKSPSPANRARDILGDLNDLWEGAGVEFHKFRQMAFSVKLRKAKLAAKLKKPPQDDPEVFEAECELEQAEIDAVQATLASGQSKVMAVIERATQKAQQYETLLLTSGVKEFTEDDFLRDEIEYLIKTAFWHAGQTFKTVDARGAAYRKAHELPPNATDAEKAAHRRKAEREGMSIRVSMDVGTYFELLGITKAEVKTELAWIDQQRKMFDRQYTEHECAQPEFADSGYFEAWLQTTTHKYRDRVLASFKDQGSDRFKRLQQIIKPTDSDGGYGSGEEMSRGSLFES